MSYTYHRFQEGAYVFDSQVIYDAIKEITQIDKLIPSKTFPNIEDLQFDFYRKSRARKPAYKPDYEKPDYIDITSLKERVDVPLLISGIKWNHLEWKRAQKDKLGVDARVAAIADEFAPQRDLIGLTGDQHNRLDSLVTQGIDDTDNTADVTTFINGVMSVNELLTTMEIGVDNDGTKGLRNIYNATPKWLLATPDVKAVMQNTWASTTNAQVKSTWDYCVEKFNGQAYSSSYLGSADYGVTAGAAHLMVGTFSKRTALLMQTDIQKVDQSRGADTIWDFEMRYRPFVVEAYGFVYTDAVTLA